MNLVFSEKEIPCKYRLCIVWGFVEKEVSWLY